MRQVVSNRVITIIVMLAILESIPNVDHPDLLYMTYRPQTHVIQITKMTQLI